MKNSFFEIKSVVIVGASQSSGKIGNDLIKNLKLFPGDRFGVNPKGGEFGGIKFYKDIKLLPIVPDMAVIVIPAKFVINSLKKIVEKGIKRIIIISAGFKEIGNNFEEEKIKIIAKNNNIFILGPNCLGYIDTYKDLNLSFGSKNVKKGNISMISQSGAMAVAFTDWANIHNLGFSKIISMGNKAALSENEILLELENDKETKVIVMYLESIEDGRSFFEITKKITLSKPIILIKAGMSEKGMKAASSHTGALAGSKEILKTAFKQSGIIYTSKLEDFFLWGKVFSEILDSELKIENIPDELIIITNAGGPGVMITDHCESLKIKLAEFSLGEKKILKIGLSETSSIKNPIDIIGDATSFRYSQILKNIKSLSKKRAIVILLTPQSITDVDKIANTILKFKKDNPDFFIMTSFMGGASIKNSDIILGDRSISEYNYSEKAVLAYSKILKYKNLLKTNFDAISYANLLSKQTIQEIKNKLSKEKLLVGIFLNGEILEALNIDYKKEILIKNEKDLINNNEINALLEKADKIIAKISSIDIAHKTDVGGIYFDISSLEDTKKAYKTIIKSVKSFLPEANISGVVFSEQLKDGPGNRQIFIGLKRDNNFGDILIVGMGGIYVNIFEDVSRRLAPVGKDEIRLMFEQLKGYKILAGFRGNKSINFDSLIDIIVKLQYVFFSFPEIKEIDINPVFVNSKGSIIIDTKFYL